MSYNTGTTTAPAQTAASCSITIPSGVLVDDVMFLAVEIFTEDSSAPAVSFSGAGGDWTLITPTDASANPQVATFGNSIWSYGYAYYRVATAGDPGATLTISESGSAAGTTWFAVALASYTAASATAPIDVAGGANAYGAYGTTITCPSETTGVNGDWAVYLGPCGPGVGSTSHGPAGTTQRQSIVSGAGVGVAINDSNGSVGNSGTGIGGGTFSSTSGSGNVWWEAFTIGLAPAGGTPVSGTDSGSGADTGTVSASIPGSDTGSGAEGTPAIGVTGPETGSGADSGSITAALSSAEAGTGADSATVGPAGADTGTGAEAGSLTAAMPGADTGSGADAGSVAASVPGSDAGTGGDAGTATEPVSDADTGSGTDAGSAAVVTSVPQLRAGLLAGTASNANLYAGSAA